MKIADFISKKRLLDIRFCIVLFFLIRIYGIWFPPIDVAHSWRQVTGNMVARNFLETDANIFYPQVDMAGEKTGITGTEFPVLNYLIYLFALVFGWNDWYGRLIVLIVSSIGSFFFYKLIKKFFSENHAFFSTILLIVSNWFIYSRKIMPDTFSVSLTIIGLWWAIMYLEKSKIRYLIGSCLLILFGVLSKIPAVIVLIPLGFVFLDKNYPIKNKIILTASLVPCIAIIYWWYFIWVPYLVSSFGYWHYYMGTGFKHGISELISFKLDVFEKFYFDALKYTGFLAFLLSFMYLFIKKEARNNQRILKLLFLAGLFCFSVFMIKSGRNFGVHSYYVIPFVPFMALIAGWGLSEIKNRKIAFLLLILIGMEGLANQQHDFSLKTSRLSMLNYENVLDKHTDKKDLIVINGSENPTDLYFTHRKGWSMSNMEIQNSETIDSIQKLGCKWIILNLHYPDKPKINYPIVYKDEVMELYSLDSACL